MVRHPLRHSLPEQLESINGSDGIGSCTSVSPGVSSRFCDGTSVLNDGITPALPSVVDNSMAWADDLFTMQGTNQIVLSFEVDPTNLNRMELSVFNCPQQGIYAPSVIVYQDSSGFLLERSGGGSFGVLVLANENLPETSCNYLYKT